MWGWIEVLPSVLGYTGIYSDYCTTKKSELTGILNRNSKKKKVSAPGRRGKPLAHWCPRDSALGGDDGSQALVG
jgi:hypothetical protein